MASRLVRKNGLPSIRVLVAGIDALLGVIHLPTYEGGRLEQIVQYLGLPNQCFHCKKLGHIAEDCLAKKSKPEVRSISPVGIPEATEPITTTAEQEWVQVGKKGKKGMPELVSNKDIALTNMFEILQDNQSSSQNQENGLNLNTQ